MYMRVQMLSDMPLECMYAHTHRDTHTHTHTDMYICIHVYVYTCKYNISIYMYVYFMDMYTQWAALHHPHVLRPAEAVAVPHGTTAGGTRHWGSTPNKAETYCLGVGLWHRNRRWLDICRHMHSNNGWLTASAKNMLWLFWDCNIRRTWLFLGHTLVKDMKPTTLGTGTGTSTSWIYWREPSIAALWDV